MAIGTPGPGPRVIYLSGGNSCQFKSYFFIFIKNQYVINPLAGSKITGKPPQFTTINPTIPNLEIKVSPNYRNFSEVPHNSEKSESCESSDPYNMSL
jgi:hypothetical protein